MGIITSGSDDLYKGGRVMVTTAIKIQELERRIEQEQNHFKKIKMTVALDKIKREMVKK